VSYWCSALVRVNPTGRLLKQLAPPNSDITDPAVIFAAYQNAAKRLRSGWKDSPEEHFSSEKQRARALGYELIPDTDIQHTEVKVWASGVVRFYWKHPDGTTVVFSLAGSITLVPKEEGERRFIAFRPGGIAVLDSEGQALLRKGQPTGDVTWTKSQIASMRQANALIACWKFHLPQERWDEDGDEDEDDNPDALPPHFYDPIGPPPLRQKQKDKAAYSSPPKPGDGTWIVNEFLNEFLEDTGGRLFTGNETAWPEFTSEHVRVQLDHFINNPIYANYPHLGAWHALLEDDRPSSTTSLRENIVFCRDILSVRQANKTGANGKWWVIGSRKEGW
jgi:hypothetical protein